MRSGRLLTIALVLTLFGGAGVARGTPTDVFFSEYIEGSSNNKALEIYNGTGAPVDLAAGGYTVQMYFNGSAINPLTIALTGTASQVATSTSSHSRAPIRQSSPRRTRRTARDGSTGTTRSSCERVASAARSST